MYTFMGVLSQRALYVNTVSALMKEGRKEEAVRMLDLCQQNVPAEVYPLETVPLGFTSNDYMVVQMVSQYLTLGEREKGRDLAVRLSNELMVSARFYLEFYDFARHDFEVVGQYIYILADELRSHGEEELAKEIEGRLNLLMNVAAGEYKSEPADTLGVK